jgi:predicted P-loop ATPase
MVVLESNQGADKSSALEVLAVESDWFTDDLPLNADSKTAIEQLAGRWIVEAGELKGMRTSDVEHLKAFLSRRHDTARLAYERRSTRVPRQCAIIGTTNEDAYLTDSTGNRRFWPVRVGAFDLRLLRRDRDQLWAEAAARDAEGVAIRLDPSLWPLAAAEQEARRIEDPYVEVLSETLSNKEGKVKAQDLWRLIDVPVGQRNGTHARRLGAIMRQLGWARDKARFGGPPERCYLKGEPPHRKLVLVDQGNYRVFENEDGGPF